VAAAARAVGWKTSAISYDPANPSTLQAAFAEALAKHPTFVTEDGIPQSQFGASTIASYKKAGVKIIVGSAFPVEIGGPIIGTPNDEASLTFIGQIVADWFVANSNGTGQALVESAPGFPVLLGFTSAFKSTVAKLCPACVVQVVDVTLAEIESGQVVPTVVAQLQGHTNLNYVFFDNDGFADGITSALAAAGLTKVTVGGNGLDVDASDGLRAGTESVWTGYSPYYNGYATVDIALRSVEGVPLTAGDGVQPTELLTKANVGGITAAWNRPTNALAQYEKLWKVKITACKLGCNGG
jgi:ribose transport system substrate-binding protein